MVGVPAKWTPHSAQKPTKPTCMILPTPLCWVQGLVLSPKSILWPLWKWLSSLAQGSHSTFLGDHWSVLSYISVLKTAAGKSPLHLVLLAKQASLLLPRPHQAFALSLTSLPSTLRGTAAKPSLKLYSPWPTGEGWGEAGEIPLKCSLI